MSEQVQAKPEYKEVPQQQQVDTKKPSEIVLGSDPIQRETGRPTDLPNTDEVLAAKKGVAESGTVCCCIDPYVNEEATVYAPGAYMREGDVYKHRTTMVRMVVCFNLCYSTEFVAKNIIMRASDGVVLDNVKVTDLENISNYFLVKSEKCTFKHHDIRRYSNVGRVLKFLCTPQGLCSTLRKIICIDDCVDTVNIRTVRCERSHYSKRHF